MTLLLFLAGLVLLIAGAELLVRGASSIARRFGIPPLVIGLTIVAMGTSAPEVAVSVRSALAGQADIALGNVVGSNIFNVLFILGLSALITPLVVTRKLVWLEVPIMIGVALLLWMFAHDGRIAGGKQDFSSRGSSPTSCSRSGRRGGKGSRTKSWRAVTGGHPAVWR